MKTSLLCFCLLLPAIAAGQVRDVKSKIKDDKSTAPSGLKSTTTTSSYEPPDVGDGCGEFIAGTIFYYTFYGIYRGFEYGQHQMQLRRPDHPETFSFNGEISSGFDFDNEALLLSPSVRVNWGLFASDLRFMKTDDVTDDMQSLDWQVFMLRFPLKNLKLEYGVGFSHVFSPSKTYFEQSAGFDWCLLQRRLTLQGTYRWSEQTSLNERYRQEVRLTADYEAGQLGRFRLAPMAGFVYQDYFGSTQFRFFQLGLRFRLF